MTRKNQKIAQSPHTMGRLNACENSVYQALLHSSNVPGTRLQQRATTLAKFIQNALVYNGRNGQNHAYIPDQNNDL